MNNLKPVLIIEDDLEAVNFLNLAFKKHFSQVEFRYDAESALQYIQEHEPGLSLSQVDKIIHEIITKFGLDFFVSKRAA